jgi:DNA-binding NtrC family response regulator
VGPFSSVAYVEPQNHVFLAGIPPEDPTGNPRTSPSQQREESSLRVLVVDDDIRIADTTAEVLMLAGFEARAAYTGDSALRLAANFRPDCVLSDVVMTGMNGVELAQKIRQRHPETRVVLMSGQVGISEILDRAEEQGIEFEILAKPIPPRKLIAELRKMAP